MAGGRDRFRTCGLCRVKRRALSGRNLERELTSADESVILADGRAFECADGTSPEREAG
jgi:hypothetical protein